METTREEGWDSVVEDIQERESAGVADLEREVCILKEALRAAILDRSRVIRRVVKYDPAGNITDIDWLLRVREWARLCGLDLDTIPRSNYEDDWR